MGEAPLPYLLALGRRHSAPAREPSPGPTGAGETHHPPSGAHHHDFVPRDIQAGTRPRPWVSAPTRADTLGVDHGAPHARPEAVRAIAPRDEAEDQGEQRPQRVRGKAVSVEQHPDAPSDEGRAQKDEEEADIAQGLPDPRPRGRAVDQRMGGGTVGPESSLPSGGLGEHRIRGQEPWIVARPAGLDGEGPDGVPDPVRLLLGLLSRISETPIEHRPGQADEVIVTAADQGDPVPLDVLADMVPVVDAAFRDRQPGARRWPRTALGQEQAAHLDPLGAQHCAAPPHIHRPEGDGEPRAHGEEEQADLRVCVVRVDEVPPPGPREQRDGEKSGDADGRP